MKTDKSRRSLCIQARQASIQTSKSIYTYFRGRTLPKKNLPKKILAILYLLCIVTLIAQPLQAATESTGLKSLFTLNEYPAPFVKQDRLEAVLVLGEHAAMSDSVAAIEIANRLEKQAVKNRDAITEINKQEPAIIPLSLPQELKIEQRDNLYTKGKTIRGIYPEIKGSDLQSLLKPDTFMGNTYTQKLVFGEKAGKFVLKQPKNKELGYYLEFAKNEPAYTYFLEFKFPVDYYGNAVNLKGEKIRILGENYFVNSVITRNGKLIELTLGLENDMIWMATGDETTYQDHTLSLVGVDSGQSRCLLKLDGTIQSVRKGQQINLDKDTKLTITDAVSLHRFRNPQGLCAMSLGRDNIVLRDQEKVSSGGVRLKGTKVTFLGESGEWAGFSVTYSVGSEKEGINSASVNLAQGESWIDPVFNNWKINFDGVTTNQENIHLKTSGNEAVLLYTGPSNNQVRVPFYYNRKNNEVEIGTENRPVLVSGTEFTGNIEGLQLLYSNQKGDTSILEIIKLNCRMDGGSITIKDRTTGRLVVNNRQLKQNCDKTQLELLDLGQLGKIVLGISDNYLRYSNDYGANPSITSQGNRLIINQNTITLIEKQKGKITPSEIAIELQWNQGPKNLEIHDVTIDAAEPAWIKEGNGKLSVAMSEKGTVIISHSKKFLEIREEANNVYAHVALTTLVPMPDTRYIIEDLVTTKGIKAILDVDAKDLQINKIVVGGPCINKLAAKLLDNGNTCTNGFSEGKGMIRLFRYNDDTTLLVAGYSAEDTLMAANVLADYEKYILKGAHIEVSRGLRGPEIAIVS